MRNRKKLYNNFLKPCECGRCDEMIWNYDKRGKTLHFKNYHHKLKHPPINTVCGCPCKQPFISTWRHEGYYTKYKQGHGTTKYPRDFSLKKCECGLCDQFITKTDKIGRPLRFIKGHGSKGRRCPTISERQRGSNNPAWKGGQHIDSEGYRHRLRSHHPLADHQGYVREHILVVEGYLSVIFGGPTYIDEPWIVHHINGNKLDNRLSNLQLMLRGEHVTLHNNMRYHPISI